MPSIKDLTIVNSNTAPAKKVEHGLLRTLCSPELCDSKNLDGLQAHDPEGQAVRPEGRQGLPPRLRDEFAGEGHACQLKNQSHAVEEGAGVLLVPGESARFDAAGGDMDLLHMVVPKPPAGGRGRIARRAGVLLQSPRRCAA